MVIHRCNALQPTHILLCIARLAFVLQGLANLRPRFVISRNGPHSERLPTAHTCFNHLLLPDYDTRDALQKRLLTAINNAEGFGLI